MARTKKITAVLHLPETEAGIRSFEKKICSFYCAQVEKQLHTYSLSKEEKLEVVQSLMEEYKS